MLGSTATSTTLGGTANVQSGPSFVPSTQTQLGGAAELGTASAVGKTAYTPCRHTGVFHTSLSCQDAACFLQN